MSFQYRSFKFESELRSYSLESHYIFIYSTFYPATSSTSRVMMEYFLHIKNGITETFRSHKDQRPNPVISIEEIPNHIIFLSKKQKKKVFQLRSNPTKPIIKKKKRNENKTFLYFRKLFSSRFLVFFLLSLMRVN